MPLDSSATLAPPPRHSRAPSLPPALTCPFLAPRHSRAPSLPPALACPLPCPPALQCPLAPRTPVPHPRVTHLCTCPAVPAGGSRSWRRRGTASLAASWTAGSRAARSHRPCSCPASCTWCCRCAGIASRRATQRAYICVCACARVCVHVCVHACMQACTCVREPGSYPCVVPCRCCAVVRALGAMLSWHCLLMLKRCCTDVLEGEPDTCARAQPCIAAHTCTRTRLRPHTQHMHLCVLRALRVAPHYAWRPTLWSTRRAAPGARPPRSQTPSSRSTPRCARTAHASQVRACKCMDEHALAFMCVFTYAHAHA